MALTYIRNLEKEANKLYRSTLRKEKKRLFSLEKSKLNQLSRTKMKTYQS